MAHSPKSPMPGSWSQQDLCETCGKRQKFVEKDGTVHPYCGRTCAKIQQSPCKISGCKDLGKSAFGGFCSPRHARDAVKTGQSAPCHRCGKQPRVIQGLCLQCNNTQGDKESSIKELTSRAKLVSVAEHVTKNWRGVGKVEVHKVFEIFLPKDVYDARDAYRKNLEVIGGTRQLHTFRGAQCICDLGVTDSSLCEWKSCGICSIIKSSFTVLEFGATSNLGRYGSGIYSYFDPSMADRFATSSLSSPYRAMLLCEVNIPTPGSNAFESPLVAKSANDDVRVFVSSAKAIIPRFVVLYAKEI